MLLCLLASTGACTPGALRHAQVQYYSTHHRSLYPHIATARQHYFFTSHAGSPVCCWDLRHVRAAACGPLPELAAAPR